MFYNNNGPSKPYHFSQYRYPYNVNPQMHDPNNPYYSNSPYTNRRGSTKDYNLSQSLGRRSCSQFIDYGPVPMVVNITKATKQNNNFRTTIWTGTHLQVTLMSIDVGSEIGLEIHPDIDQFLRIEEGQGLVKMGQQKNNLDFQADVYDDIAILIPAGTWHNVINTGKRPLKLYSIYAPPAHPKGTIHKTKEEAMEAENDY